MYLKKFQSVKYVVRPMSEKRRSKTPFHSQRVKGSQTFVKSAWKIKLFLEKDDPSGLCIYEITDCQICG